MGVDDPIWGAPPLARVKPPLSLVSPDDKPLVLRPARLPLPSTIPPRQWLYGTQLIRGFVTVLVAPGGTGKSSYAMAVGLALATGQPFLGEHIFARVNAAVLNLEDPMDELNRRLAALIIRHRIDETEVEGRYFIHSGEDRQITMAAFDQDGFTIVHPDEQALIAEIKAHEIGLLIVDPYAESHTLEENSNPQMVKAAASWRRVARATSCAIMLVHHVRKGAVTDIDSARGAKALTDSARVGLLMSPMSQDEGEQLGIPADQRSLYVRLDDAKANMAPKAAKARWFELDRVELGNATRDYPHGDRVAAIVPWQARSVWESLSDEDCNAALDRIGAGLNGGKTLFAPSKRGKDNDRWAGSVLVDAFDLTEEQAKMVIKTWLKNGLLLERTYKDPIYRKERTGVVVEDSKRPTRAPVAPGDAAGSGVADD